MKCLQLSILTIAFIAMCGCGEHTYYGELYKKHSISGTSKVDEFRIRIIIHESHPGWDKGMWFFLLSNTNEKHGAPYELIIASTFYGQTNDTVKIHEVKLKIGSQSEIILHSEIDDNMQITYKPWMENAVSGNIKLPLHDKLPFLDGQKVTVTVKYQPPNSSQIYEVETVYVGKVKKRTYTSIDVLNSV